MTRQVVTVAVAAGIGFAAGWLVRGGGGGATADAAPGGDAGDGAAAGGGASSGREGEAASAAGKRVPEEEAAAAGRAGGGGEGAAAETAAAGRAGGGKAAFDVEAARQALRVAELEARLREAEARLAEAERGRKEEEEPAGATAAERRAAAARDGKILVEFPQWSDQLEVPPEVAEQYGLSDAEREALGRLYREFYTQGMGELRRLYRELTGDPRAGESSTLNALLHDVIELSPQEPCRARMAEALRLLAAGQPLPAPGADAPACAWAVWFLFQAVDRMEREAGVLGPAARDALWSSRSTFLFSGRSDGSE